MEIKVKNTVKNFRHLSSIGIAFSEQGQFLVVTPNQYHQSLMACRQLSVAAYKKNVLGL